MIFTSLHLIIRDKLEEFSQNIIVPTEVEFDKIPEESIISYSKSEFFK